MAERGLYPDGEQRRRIMDFIMAAGQTLLENGAEVFRVEQTMEIMADRGRSCWGSGQQDASAFARSERWEPQPGFHKEKPLSALGHPGSGQLFKKPAIPGT